MYLLFWVTKLNIVDINILSSYKIFLMRFLCTLRVQFVLPSWSRKFIARRWSFLLLVVLSFRRGQREPGRECLYGHNLSLSRGSATERTATNRHSVTWCALANSNLSADTLAKCGMSWQSCRICSCCPFWRFLDESLAGNFPAENTSSHHHTGAVTFVHDVAVSKSFGHSKSVVFIGRVT